MPNIASSQKSVSVVNSMLRAVPIIAGLKKVLENSTGLNENRIQGKTDSGNRGLYNNRTQGKQGITYSTSLCIWMKKKFHKKGVIKKKIFLRITKEKEVVKSPDHVVKRHSEEEKKGNKMRKRKRESKLLWYNRKGDSWCSDNELFKKFHSNP